MTDDPPGDQPDRPTDEPGDEKRDADGVDDDPVDDRVEDGSAGDRAGDEPADDRPPRGRWPDAESAEGSGWLADLLTALDRFGELSVDDRRRPGSSIVDYSVSVRSGIGDVDGDRGSDRDRRDRRSRSPRGERPRRRTRREGTGSNHRVTTRTYEDELLVTADVAGVDPDGVAVGFDGGELVVGVDDRELDRVALPWSDPVVDAVVRNGVLTVTVEPDGDGEPEDGVAGGSGGDDGE